MNQSSPWVLRALRSRTVVLGAALVAAFAVIAATDGPAGTAREQPTGWQIVRDARAADPAPAPPGAKPDADAPAGGARVDAEITIDERGVRIGKPGRNAPQVTVGEHEYDSFEAFVEQAPWIAGLVFMTTAFVFLVPLLVIILVIWYKMRRTRMMNETMLKLAERGVVPPGEAMQAIAEGRTGTAIESGPATRPLHDQARTLGKRAAWSDLRKGVIMGAIGLGLSVRSLFDGDSPHGLGLVLLFVGIGFVVLWYFEERRAAGRDGAPREPAEGS